MRSDRIARLLPEVYQRTIGVGTPIASLLEVMSQLHEPVEETLRRLPEYFDPQRTPDRFVPFLARWVDLDRWLDDAQGQFDAGSGRLRQVVAAAARLSRLRGTAQGLREALEWATGVAGVRIDEEVTDGAGRPRPFHVVVSLPAAAAAHQVLVRRIVQQEKPAHVTAEIVFAGGPVSADAGAPEVAAPPTLPVGGPAHAPEPSFPGSQPAPVLTGAPGPTPESADPSVGPAAELPPTTVAEPPAPADHPAPPAHPALAAEEPGA
ncbi:phage tail protein [Microbacterium sp. zg.Y625]|uniref:phage tail protein n=1 Tax=Microbacterium jiangjiandongii TaxID=3049071 RepID=UPI00214B9D08|nr:MULTISPECIES: phage tail protein [unclassified Microbacterium]MCR2792306.1 phage tail protein [Microbacterium sp. zg.Y625]MCR2815096.1 phage tail protein [Microbacterium sp. zg.Y843]WIM25102.1 phage tail protein [Microbacterium sp. zg-Y625]